MLARTSLKRGVALARRYATSQQIQGRSLARTGVTQHGLTKAIPSSRHSNTGFGDNDRCVFLRSQYRYFSSVHVGDDVDLNPKKPIRILYGSQGGTAQVFSMQLEDQVEDREVTTLGLHESSTPPELFDPSAIHVIVVSVAGVGEPPDNARAFYKWLMSADAEQGVDWSLVEYTVFGLGNKKAHSNHYNVIGKSIDARLQQLGAVRVHEIGLGDDGECIEDDFDVWLASFLKTLNLNGHEEEEDTVPVISRDELSVLQDVVAHENRGQDLSDQRRVLSSKYPALVLEQSGSDMGREDLFHLQNTPEPFYPSGFCKFKVTGNRVLNARSAEYGLREMRIATPDSTYVAGDHFCVYPKNSQCLVEAYIQMLNVDPHVLISKSSDSRSKPYPHPTGITLFETLLHCVDLGAVPSPSFSRELLGRKDIDYKKEIANPCRTVLDLALESSSTQRESLEDFLYNMPPMQPRYYSISSSPLLHPHDVYLTYRPVRYVSSHGCLREGICTSYLSNLTVDSQVIGAIQSNPTFRLPQDPLAPILLMAGGCGIAAIRSFLEERLALADIEPAKFGDGHLFLGFRSPCDEVYRDMVDAALQKGALSNVQVSYSSGGSRPNQLVSDTVRENGQMVWDVFENGGYTYLCGGARTFGVAIEREVLAIIQKHGNMSEEDAINYLRQLMKEGRFCEDLAD